MTFSSEFLTTMFVRKTRMTASIKAKLSNSDDQTDKRFTLVGNVNKNLYIWNQNSKNMILYHIIKSVKSLCLKMDCT